MVAQTGAPRGPVGENVKFRTLYIMTSVHTSHHLEANIFTVFYHMLPTTSVSEFLMLLLPLCMLIYLSVWHHAMSEKLLDLSFLSLNHTRQILDHPSYII